jgi:hypothetical protein
MASNWSLELVTWVSDWLVGWLVSQLINQLAPTILTHFPFSKWHFPFMSIFQTRKKISKRSRPRTSSFWQNSSAA